jgi:hypothetical protein
MLAANVVQPSKHILTWSQPESWMQVCVAYKMYEHHERYITQFTHDTHGYFLYKKLRINQSAGLTARNS